MAPPPPTSTLPIRRDGCKRKRKLLDENDDAGGGGGEGGGADGGSATSSNADAYARRQRLYRQYLGQIQPRADDFRAGAVAAPAVAGQAPPSRQPYKRRGSEEEVVVHYDGMVAEDGPPLGYDGLKHRVGRGELAPPLDSDSGLDLGLDRLDGEVARLVTLDERGARHVLRLQLGVVFTIGRDPQSDYLLPLPHVSRKHARLLAVPSQDPAGSFYVVCEDVSSRGGVRVNGVRIRKAHMLAEGDEVGIAGRVFKLVYLDGSNASYPQLKKAGIADPPAKQAAKNVQVVEWLDSVAVTDKILGLGAYAQVLLGYMLKDGALTQVAVKKQVRKSPPEGTHSGWKVELELIQSLRHPNINRILGVFSKNEYIYMVLELHQLDLMVFLSHWGALQVPSAKFIFYQLLSAVKHLHDRDISHRDIKPENVYLDSAATPFPRICLGDFGLAYKTPPPSSGGKGANGIAAGFRTFSFCGTPGYLPPEVFRQHVTMSGYDPKALDMWSCGVTLFCMLSAYHPFDALARPPRWSDMQRLIADQMAADGELSLASPHDEDGEYELDSNFATGHDDGEEAHQTSDSRGPHAGSSLASVRSLADELLELNVGLERGVTVGSAIAANLQPIDEADEYDDIDGVPFHLGQGDCDLSPLDGQGPNEPEALPSEREYIRNILHANLPEMPWRLRNDAAGQDIIHKLINAHPHERLTAPQALLHEWLASAQPALWEMYRSRVLGLGREGEGEVGAAVRGVGRPKGGTAGAGIRTRAG